MHVVWLKRDLRLRDHAPLLEASARGEVLFLYVYEPELWRSLEMDSAHLVFVNQALAELDDSLRERGARVTFRVGNLPEVFEELHRERPISALYSHEETGAGITCARDRRVRRWTQERGIPWREFPQTGVVRGLKNRDGWAAQWQKRMSQPILPPPGRICGAMGIDPQGIRTPLDLGLPPSGKQAVQPGGSQAAWDTLESFLMQRGVDYRAAMSSPVTGWERCSRLSPYLAWGCISLKEVFQRTSRRAGQLKEMRERDTRWLPSLQSFLGRLRWHCHFIQKLEDEPRLEYENLHRACDGLREEEFREDLFQAWCEGQTGFPMVDACMRCVKSTGWLNFRMRAMLASFAAYHLWLHWRRPAVFLARHFLDFEPGIHFSQFQMQSGTTGINTIRIYSPAKQARDQDPEGKFIRRWVPELQAVPLDYLAEPHRMPGPIQQMACCIIGRDYPGPIVDSGESVKKAKERIYALRRRAAAREEAHAIQRKHGSRKRITPAHQRSFPLPGSVGSIETT